MTAAVKSMTKINAKKFFDSLNEQKLVNYDVKDLNSDIARELTKKFEDVKEAVGDISKNTYQFDLLFGLELYELLNNKYNFTVRDSSNLQIWYALQLLEVPHIVYARWGLNEERFVKISRRIYLWTLWWYIHISWQGNRSSTYEVLKDNNTDTIQQMVERPGKSGYRIEVYRKVMYYYHKYTKEIHSRDLLRKAMKLHTIKCKNIEPALYHGGIDQYAEDLFTYFIET
ncbi:hypothetical protein [Gracilibacillus alcaliphilus]|uniref:hypothetical protein n=1 Tax=Gracilibacillus alcaliphilus TaxID=1401441 RepID=UPI00195D231E|nr:hypothetical protein [Gracilibacillus alcaliphilus]MBM7679598.1 hypothetical protein [Gracilibacillus alcaliphilus]